MATDSVPLEILRESIRSRAEQTLPGAASVFAVVLVLAFLLLDLTTPVRLAAWLVPLGAAMGLRVVLARFILRRLDRAAPRTLQAWDAWLRYSSMLNQTLCGAGIWLVGAAGTEAVAFFLTLAIALFGVGAMINLTSDYRSFRDSMPLLMAQPVAYWLMHGADGLRIAFPLAVISLLMLSLVRRSSRSMADSVRMRFEKNRLLDRVESERQATEQALQVANSAMRARAVFLAAASHDLRQPLYAISLLSDAMVAEPLPDHAAVLLAKQRQAISVLRTLFDNLLDLSRFDAGEVRPRLRDVRLRDVLGSLCTEYEVVCQAKGVQWSADIDDIWVHTDPELLRRLAGNLLSNAARYTSRGSVSFRMAREEGKAAFSVEDTGCGIPAEEQDRIFEEFVQLGNPARDREQGVGLGLSIVRRISSLLEAEVEIRSTVAQGTRVTFSVPLSTAPCMERVPVAVAAEAPGFEGVRVWVVEDDPLVRDALASQFAAWGARCDFAVDRQGLMNLRHEADGRLPDAAILDDMLGAGEQGLEIARWLEQSMPRERIILVTGNVDPERTRQLEQSGFVVLPKPLAAEDLAESLRDALREGEPAR